MLAHSDISRAFSCLTLQDVHQLVPECFPQFIGIVAGVQSEIPDAKYGTCSVQSDQHIYAVSLLRENTTERRRTDTMFIPRLCVGKAPVRGAFAVSSVIFGSGPAPVGHDIVSPVTHLDEQISG